MGADSSQMRPPTYYTCYCLLCSMAEEKVFGTFEAMD